MIPDLWTLEPRDSPAAAQPLHALGITRATLARATQSAATLSLTIERGDALTMDLSAWAWESRWVLRRAGAVQFRGRVKTCLRAGAAEAESVSIELRDLWWDMERSPFLQEWRVLRRDGSTEGVWTPRARIAFHPVTGARGTTLHALQQIAAAALRSGIALAINPGSLPALAIPPIEAANQSVAEMVRAVLRWHPEASAAIEDGEIAPGVLGDVLRIRVPSVSEPLDLHLGGAPLSSLDIAERPDLQVDSVHLSYEAETTRYSEHPAEDPSLDEPVIRTRRRLVVHRDVYPPGHPVTRRSLCAVLPAPPLPEAAAPPSPPLPHAVAIQTRPLPADGAYDAAAEKWWLDMLGLSALGITKDDIRLPRTKTEQIQTHRVRFAWKLDDPDDPAQMAPDPLNPKSKPVWRPKREKDLPRMLVSGTLAGWMRVRASELVVDCHVAVLQSAVDALEAAPKKIFMRLAPTAEKVLGQDVWMVYRQIKIVGTTAKTRTYRRWPATGSAAPATDMREAWDRSRDEAVIPHLARRLWTERRAIPLEGSATLSAEECGGVRLLGRRLRILHPARPEWASMPARVRGESLDLASGSTSVSFGPDEHLGPQDRAELHGALRRAAKPETADLPSPEPPAQEPDEGEPPAGLGGVVAGGPFSPLREVVLPPTGGTAEGRWDLVPGDSPSTWKLRAPLVFAGISNLGTEIAVANNGIAIASASRWVVLQLDNVAASPQSYTLTTVASEPGGGLKTYEFDPSTDALVAARLPLWRIDAESSPGSVPIGDFFGVKIIGDGAMALASHQVPVPHRPQARFVPRLVPL